MLSLIDLVINFFYIEKGLLFVSQATLIVMYEKNIFLLFIGMFICFNLSAQNNLLDSLIKEKENLDRQQKTIKLRIREVDNKVIENIRVNGFKVVYLPISSNDELFVKDSPFGSGDVIDKLVSGDTFSILAFSVATYKIEVRGKIGYVYLTQWDSYPTIKGYPLVLLDEKTREEHYSGNTHSSKANLGNSTNKTSTKSSRTSNRTRTKDCSSVRCSATTQKGTRCKNKTTNCNGRCHLH